MIEMMSVMVACKKCQEKTAIVKSGFVRGKQRFKCKNCGCHFVDGDHRQVYSVEARAMAIIMYGMCKASYGTIAGLFKTSRAMVYQWVKQYGKSFPEPEIPEDTSDIEFDEMWHFIQQKKTKFGSGRHWTVARGRLLPELSVIVMLKRSNDCTTNSNT